jgi:hypothetical protein
VVERDQWVERTQRHGLDERGMRHRPPQNANLADEEHQQVARAVARQPRGCGTLPFCPDGIAMVRVVTRLTVTVGPMVHRTVRRGNTTVRVLMLATELCRAEGGGNQVRAHDRPRSPDETSTECSHRARFLQILTRNRAAIRRNGIGADAPDGPDWICGGIVGVVVGAS